MTTAGYNPREHGARCDMCPLRGKAVVPPALATPEGGPRLVVVGEAPGHIEEREKQPFLGHSGNLLLETLRLQGGPKARGELHLTNAALCRGESDEDNKRAAECCAPRLLGELGALPAAVTTILLGATAVKSVLGIEGILKTRGFVWTAPTLDAGKIAAANRAAKRLAASDADNALLRVETLRGRATLAGRRMHPTLHPAFVLRTELWAAIFERDIRRAVSPLPTRLDSDVDGRHTAGGIETLASLGPNVSLDIETDALDPMTVRITCVGVSDGEQTGVLYPWIDEMMSGLQTWLRTRKSIVAHNGFSFDQIVLARHGLQLEGIRWGDTLTMHHTLYSHYPHSLAHVVTETCDAEPWKLLSKAQTDDKGFAAKLSGAQLCKYNAQDAQLTARAAQRMSGALGRQDQRVYEHDLQVSAVCRDMQLTGTPVDILRLGELRTALEDTAAGLQWEMRRLANWPELAPSKVADVRDVLYRRLNLPVTRKTAKGIPSTDNAVIETLRTAPGAVGDFARSLARWRLVTKTLSTRVNGIPLNAETGRAHYNWRFTTTQGRMNCVFQSTPRYSPKDRRTGSDTPEGRVRELTAAPLGTRLVYFDVSQAEMRIAAYISGDETFMRACEGDVHANNAKVLFPEIAAKGWLDDPEAKKDAARGKPYRDIAKNVGFALTYVADDETVYLYLRAHGFPVEFPLVVRMLSNLRAVYRGYFRFVDANLREVRSRGWMRTPVVGRIRWLGWTPKITEVANMPVQGGLADVMNLRMLEIAAQMPGARLIAQIHDACIYETPRGIVETMKACIAETWAKPIPEMRNLVLPIDLKVGDRWSEF